MESKSRMILELGESNGISFFFRWKKHFSIQQNKNILNPVMIVCCF